MHNGQNIIRHKRQGIRSGAGQLLLSAKAPHRAAAFHAGVVGGEYIDIAVAYIQSFLW